MEKDTIQAVEGHSVSTMAEQRDRGNWFVESSLDKYDENGNLTEHLDIEGNLLLNEGITELLTLLIGGSATAYSNANAQLGVGDSSTAANAGQADLQAATNKVYVGMDATYPQVADQTVTFRATFDGSTANFAWNEWSIRNGSSANKNLNRKVATMGTKASGTIWVLTVSVTIS
jgi:hypothetical protein